MLRSPLQWIIWTILPWVYGGRSLFAQHQVFHPNFEIFVLPGGEGANQVQCIIQDRVGFLWFGSRSGLIRYDGAQYVTYQSDPNDTTTIGHNYINWIHQDSRGILWLAHVNDGLTAFDPVTEKGVRYRHLDNDPNSLANNYVSQILEDASGNIWVATGRGLDRLDPPKNRQGRRPVRHYRLEPGQREDFVRSLYVDKNNTLWVGCGSPYFLNWPGGLYRYNPNGTFSRNLLHTPDADNRVQCMLEDRRGNFWLGTCGPRGLYRKDADHFVRLSSPALKTNNHLFPQFEHTTFLFEDRQGRLWTGAVEGGLDVYDPTDGTTSHFEKETNRPGRLQAISIWHGCQATDGSVWLACGDNGLVYRVTQTETLFPFYDMRRRLGVRNCAVTGIREAPPNQIWMQILGDFNGLVRYDRSSGAVQKYPYRVVARQTVLFDLFELERDRDGTLWAGTSDGLFRLRTTTTSAVLERDPVFSKQIIPGPVLPPFQDKRGNTWVPAFGRGLYRFVPGQKNPRLCAYDPNDPASISSNLVERVFEDRQGRLWVCGASDGYNQGQPMFLDRVHIGQEGQPDSFEHLLPPGELGELSGLVEDRQGNFWFSAFPYGICKLNPETGEYRKFTVANSSLTTVLIPELLPGPDGMIWMFGQNAIIRLNPETESFFTFSPYHGIVDSAVFVGCYTGSCVGSNGKLFFGGDGGFYAFDPRVLHNQLQRFPAKSKITDLKIFGKRVVPGSSILHNQPLWEIPEVYLQHDQNVFSLQVASFDFGGPQSSRLEYKLENYDLEWRADLHAGEATYIRVPPGHYLFRVRGFNSVGEPIGESHLHIIVRPPWWQRWWARLLFALALGSGLFLLYRFLLNRKLERAEQLRLRELNNFKARFYTNITHEFRTPLTLLLGPVERQLQESKPGDDAHGVLQTVRRNALQLLNLVNQMLDLAKLDSGTLALHPVQGDIVRYLKYLVEAFRNAAENKQIRIHFLSGPEALVMDFEEEKMRQIGSNLLSNALKFTPEGGDVYVRLYTEPLKSNNHTPGLSNLILQVRDTGVGIPEAQLPFIFERFYQVDNALTRPAGGAGLGLSLTRELVRLMGGEITVLSRPGWGTEFTVSLPVTRFATPAEIGQVEAGLDTPGRHKGGPVSPVKSLTDDAPLILIVEDDADVVEYLISCLPDYRLTVARDGQEGYDSAMENVPDVLISDVMMPRMDGLQLCRMLKKDPRTSHIPIILLTAKADHDSTMEGLEQGADAYLAKPFYHDELLLRIQKLLENRKALQEHYLGEAGLRPQAAGSTAQPPAGSTEHVFVQKARELVEMNLDDSGFDVEQFCRALTMSHSQVHRKLSALTGLSAVQFIRHIRLNKACEMLLDPALTITSIAFDCGFNDPAYFGRVFKQTYGLTPQGWREQHGRE
ncbi:MAG: response regulator [Lewinellaceae bacterium]|nr:response regulator [Lewinellaceae bacterium]